jgi:hypothetical protein
MGKRGCLCLTILNQKLFVVLLSRTLMFHVKPLYAALYYHERDRAAEILSTTSVQLSSQCGGIIDYASTPRAVCHRDAAN